MFVIVRFIGDGSDCKFFSPINNRSNALDVNASGVTSVVSGLVSLSLSLVERFSALFIL
jgi:hypothetical protein